MLFCIIIFVFHTTYIITVKTFLLVKNACFFGVIYGTYLVCNKKSKNNLDQKNEILQAKPPPKLIYLIPINLNIGGTVIQFRGSMMQISDIIYYIHI